MTDKLKTADELKKDIEAFKNKEVVTSTEKPFLSKEDGKLPSDEPVLPKIKPFEHALSTEEKQASLGGTHTFEQKKEERPVGSENVNQVGVDKSEENLLSNHLVEEANVMPPTLRGLDNRNERIAEVLKLHSSDSQQYEKSYKMILAILDEFADCSESIHKR